ncbi:MAG: HNH endonuclease [Candidatus Nanoarchaeia archaeon]
MVPDTIIKEFSAGLHEVKNLEKERKFVDAYYRCFDILKNFAQYSYYPKLHYERGETLIKHLANQIIKTDLKELGKEGFEPLFCESLEEIVSRPKASYVDYFVLENAVTERMSYNFLASKKADEKHYNFIKENRTKYKWHFEQELKKQKYAKLRNKLLHKVTYIIEYLKSIPAPRGSIDWRIKQKVLQRTHWRCTYCGRSGWWSEKEVNLQIDHIFPFAKGGKTELSNLVAACTECNKEKSDICIKNSTGQIIENYDMLVKYSNSVPATVVIKNAGIRYRKPTFFELYRAGFKCQNAKCGKAAMDGATLFMCVGNIILCTKCSTGAKCIESFFADNNRFSNTL